MSPFLLEALDLSPATPVEMLRPSIAERLARHDRRAIPRTADAPRPPVIGDRPLNLSYGQVSDYLDCPARYRYAHVIRIPTPASHQMAYGRALHAAVQAFHRQQLAGAAMPLSELLAELDAAWESVGFLTRRHEEARREAARDALRRFWQEQQSDPARPTAIEQEFAVNLGRERVRGRYDRVDLDEHGRVSITDYKSSDVRDPATANRRARESLQLSIYALAYEAEHGRVSITDYKSSDVRDPATANRRARESLQLSIYALAYEAEHSRLPDEVALHFLESGVVGRVAPTAKRLEKAAEQVAQVGAGIREAQFEAAPSPMRCGFCPFREICPDAAR
jgi:DNA helicase-2/ATP-dependent DNA helicase PcrA